VCDEINAHRGFLQYPVAVHQLGADRALRKPVFQRRFRPGALEEQRLPDDPGP